MPRVNDRRVAHKSTGGIPPKIPTPVGSVGNAPNHLTTNTVARSANESLRTDAWYWHSAQPRANAEQGTAADAKQ
jgi:hypothetical protein